MTLLPFPSPSSAQVPAVDLQGSGDPPPTSFVGAGGVRADGSGCGDMHREPFFFVFRESNQRRAFLLVSV
jgi:hypothetical protein